ncbi:hypothetical protein COZ13_03185 [Candidatus Desantisbacteria bacterium CG_4_10_14_3_um_filter_40_18]|uniref:Uncharacterized protein n=1 Tax=Candidatus Desantisbacteria bacterium CG_4_10_14_3_um_filter_40_18 TaxID=1974544 RepID=A0A2M7P3K6_9BACT|nr:MAG: hypothetical protein COZ13_03185 [Candidatus Desantisbacteria bacterium CG_4_10_14_3_um_filter_40_18]
MWQDKKKDSGQARMTRRGRILSIRSLSQVCGTGGINRLQSGLNCDTISPTISSHYLGVKKK